MRISLRNRREKRAKSKNSVTYLNRERGIEKVGEPQLFLGGNEFPGTIKHRRGGGRSVVIKTKKMLFRNCSVAATRSFRLRNHRGRIKKEENHCK